MYRGDDRPIITLRSIDLLAARAMDRTVLTA
jgi:hypothetical protein